MIFRILTSSVYLIIWRRNRKEIFKKVLAFFDSLCYTNEVACDKENMVRWSSG